MAKKKDLSPLDLDLIQCEKDGFGCHYGKWKATQEQKKIEPEQPNKFPVRICEYCGGEFTRKFDLVRWGIWYERVVENTQNNVGLKDNIRKYHEYYPISDVEC